MLLPAKWWTLGQYGGVNGLKTAAREIPFQVTGRGFDNGHSTGSGTYSMLA